MGKFIGKRKNIYITNEKVLTQIEKQGNQSHYIEQLVLKDLRGLQEELSREEIIKLIDQRVGNRPLEKPSEGGAEKEKLLQILSL